ncbi:Maltose transport system permease protein malG [Serratia marcescens]|uniref:Maltose/maltodextrin transport system permease protein MalG n=2 Tax=Serratia marcescens TaxID=615 RepID=A0A379YDI7_SERMA|nr:Maltose transport system permease protein malG [Serratia marcescens]
MAMVQPKSQRLRLWITHILMLCFIALIMFPLLMVVAISLRSGNFATGSLIPETLSWDHWRLALGFSVTHADGSVTPPPFPVLLWLWNSIKIAAITAIGIVTLSTTCAYAFARMRFRGKSTLLKSMLIFQMFPAVLSLVALYALFDRLGQYIPFIGLNTHGGVIFAYMGGIALHVWTIKGLFRNHRQFAGRSGGAGWRHAVASVPSGAVAAVGADSGGGIHSVIYRRHHRSAGGVAAAARCEQLHAGGGDAAISQPAELPVGRLRRRRGAVGDTDYRRVPAGAALAGGRPDGRRREGVICATAVRLMFFLIFYPMDFKLQLGDQLAKPRRLLQ